MWDGVSMVTQVYTHQAHHTAPCGSEGGAGVVDFTRLRYFHGQPLAAADLRREQAYHRNKARLHNRLLHGWGIVCGLDLRVAPRSGCDDPKDPTAIEVILLPGAAIDCRGNEIVV